jgi:hypothetical protein
MRGSLARCKLLPPFLFYKLLSIPDLNKKAVIIFDYSYEFNKFPSFRGRRGFEA